MRAGWVAVAALLSGCVGGGESELGAGSIIGGTEITGEPAVGVVRIGDDICSGTLVEPGIVLTAKHCFARGTRPADVTFSTGLCGENLAGVATAFTHLGNLDGRVTDRDVLVLTLDTPADAGRVTLRRQAMSAADVGSSVRLVGFGVVDASETTVKPLKREGTTTIDAMGRNHFNVQGGQQNCWGDSGGAAFQGDVLVGVIASTTTRSCSEGSIMRVDRNLDLIDRARAKATWTVSDASGPSGNDGGGEDLPGYGTSGGDDSCVWANDGACDEPTYCDPGTDTTDCRDREPEFAADEFSCSCDPWCEDDGTCCWDC